MDGAMLWAPHRGYSVSGVELTSINRSFPLLYFHYYSSLDVVQLCSFGRVINGRPESHTLLRQTYSSSSPDAPLTPIAPTTSLSRLRSNIPPGKAAILPRLTSTMLFIWQNLEGSPSLVYLSRNSHKLVAPKAQVSGAQRFLFRSKYDSSYATFTPTLAYLWYLVQFHLRICELLRFV